MSVPNLVRDPATTTPAGDALATLFERAADRDCHCNASRTDGIWYVALFQYKPRAFVYATNSRLDLALHDALAKLPQETARV